MPFKLVKNSFSICVYLLFSWITYFCLTFIYRRNYAPVVTSCVLICVSPPIRRLVWIKTGPTMNLLIFNFKIEFIKQSYLNIKHFLLGSHFYERNFAQYFSFCFIYQMLENWTAYCQYPCLQISGIVEIARYEFEIHLIFGHAAIFKAIADS